MDSLLKSRVNRDSRPNMAADEASGGEVDVRELIARNLVRLRNQRGLSLMTLSARSGVSYWTLQEVELGRALPTIEVLWKAARVLGVPCDAFVETPDSTSAPAGMAGVATQH